MADAAANASSLIGAQLGRYRVTARLGAGGMGEVYAAEDPTLGRRVAVKILPPEMAHDTERRARFEREARAIAALSHPNIVTVHAVEEAEGRAYLVMELVAGKTLADLIPRGGLATERLLELGIPLADAVAAAHAQGITHRDLKPHNVMVTDEGRVKVLDFGLAKVEAQEGASAHADTATATGEGRILGTAAYMSPEQAQGKKVDARSDIFSLGVVLFEMATGRRPFEGDNSVSLIAAILRDSPPSVTDLNRALPGGLARIVRRCLAKEPGRRYQSSADLRNDLEELRDDARSGIDRAPAASAVPKRRWPLVVWLAALVPLSLFAVGFVVHQVRRERRVDGPRESEESKRAPSIRRLTRLTSDPGPERAPSLSPDGKSVIYASRIGGNWDVYQLRVGGENAMNLTGDSRDDDGQAVFSPDGERIAFRSERGGGGIFVMGATGESVRRLSDFGYQPSWSPDGSEVVVSTQSMENPGDTGGASGELWVIRVATGEKRLVAPAFAVQAAWSPHGQRIAFWGRAAKGKVRNVYTVPAAGGPAVALTDDLSLHFAPAWSPDGRYLYYASDRAGETNLWRTAVDEESGAPEGEAELVTVGAGIESHSPSFARSGGRLLFATGRQDNLLSKIHYDPVKEVTTGAPIPLATGANPRVRGDWIAYEWHNPAGVYVIKTDGTGRRRLTEEAPGTYQHTSWSPDGSEIAFTSQRGAGGKEAWSVHPDGSGLRQLAAAKPGLSILFAIWGKKRGQMFANEGDGRSQRAFEFDPTRPFAEQTPTYLPAAPAGVSLIAIDLSPDEREIAFVRRTDKALNGVWILDRGTGKYRELSANGNTASYLPDGKRLLFENRGELWIAETKSGRSHPLVTVSEGFVDNCQSADREWVYFNHIVERADLWLAELE